MFKYDPETKRQSEEWHPKHSPRPKKACMMTKVKTMITFSTAVILLINNF